MRTTSSPSFGRRRVRMAAALTGLALACAALPWTPLGPHRTAVVPNAEPLGAEECSVCHEQVQGHPRIAAYHSDCESCHGGGSLHADSEEPADIRYPDTRDCLACHAAGRRTHLQWQSGDHARAGLLCSDCHNPHTVSDDHLRVVELPDPRNLDAASMLCARCHADTAAAFRFPSHHPVLEGAMGCLSCHDPHSDLRSRLGDRNEVCAACHQDVMGPWVFEHPPAVEDCGFCHSPHGAAAEALLDTTQPVLCLSCHSLADDFHHEFTSTGITTNRTISQDRPTDPAEQISSQQARTFLRRCSDCHSAVHGSYTDEHLRH